MIMTKGIYPTALHDIFLMGIALSPPEFNPSQPRKIKPLVIHYTMFRRPPLPDDYELKKLSSVKNLSTDRQRQKQRIHSKTERQIN